MSLLRIWQLVLILCKDLRALAALAFLPDSKLLISFSAISSIVLNDVIDCDKLIVYIYKIILFFVKINYLMLEYVPRWMLFSFKIFIA